jgi:pimeloyl-ACP methyl ester carboxylesterase
VSIESLMDEVNIISGDRSYIHMPNTWRNKKDGSLHGCMILHGGGTQPSLLFDSQIKQLLIPMSAHYPCITSYAGGNLWLNDTSLNNHTTIYNYMINPTGLGVAPEIFLFGNSMGGGDALAWARANKTKVKGLILHQPLLDLNDIIVDDKLGQGAEASASYAGGYSNTTYGATHNPVMFADQLADIPILLLTSINDGVITPDIVLNFIHKINEVPDNKLELLPLYSYHGDLSTVPVDRIIEFMDRVAA